MREIFTDSELSRWMKYYSQFQQDSWNNKVNYPALSDRAS
jgi:hypothetical protein